MLWVVTVIAWKTQNIAKIAELENQWISVEDEMLIVVNDKVLGLEQGE